MPSTPPRSKPNAGQLFRRDNTDIVLLALQLLEESSRRQIPEYASDERSQKNMLSNALVNFLQACSHHVELGADGALRPYERADGEDEYALALAAHAAGLIAGAPAADDGSMLDGINTPQPAKEAAAC